MMWDVFCWVCIGIIILFVLAVMFALCMMAGKWDYISEECWNEYCEKENERMQAKAQESYERYRARFAHDYGKTIEESTECSAVKQYKVYLEKQHGVVICEKVGDA